MAHFETLANTLQLKTEKRAHCGCLPLTKGWVQKPSTLQTTTVQIVPKAEHTQLRTAPAVAPLRRQTVQGLSRLGSLGQGAPRRGPLWSPPGERRSAPV